MWLTLSHYTAGGDREQREDNNVANTLTLHSWRETESKEKIKMWLTLSHYTAWGDGGTDSKDKITMWLTLSHYTAGGRQRAKRR